MRLVFVAAVLLGLSASAHATGKPDTKAADVAVLHRMLAAREAGTINAPDYYSGTSADVQAYYLMANAWDTSGDFAERKGRSEKLLSNLLSKINRRGECLGWGIGADLDAFGDGSMNPASTIYVYTSARVVRSLLEAEKAGLIKIPEEIIKRSACSFKNLFHFDANKPQLQYSDNANDAGYLVFNVFADLAAVSADLEDRVSDRALGSIAKQACEVLERKTGSDGFLPYFEGRGTTDPTHHAMVLNGLIMCQRRYSIGTAAVTAATQFLYARYFPDGEFKPGEADPEWAAGEALIALSDLCKSDANACRHKEAVLRYVRQHENAGAVNNKAARFQSWLAAGIAYATR